MTVLAVACLAAWSVAFPPVRAEAGQLEIPAWTFDRGNAKVFPNPDIYGDYRDKFPDLVVGDGGEKPWVVEYDVDFPVDATYTLEVRFGSPEKRPLEFWLDDKKIGTCCDRVTGNAAPDPGQHPRHGRSVSAKGFHGLEWEEVGELQVPKGKHTLKFTRDGLPPRLSAFRLGSSAGFPRDRKPTERKPVLDRIPPRYRRIFMPPESVNVETLRLAIEDVVAQYGSRYPKGPAYLTQLAELVAQLEATENGTPQGKKIEGALKSLEREAMLAHPLLDFDKLLFVKLKGWNRAPIYNDYPTEGEEGSSICILSLASPGNKVVELAPQLAGGWFGQFDLSFDAKKVVFAYKKEGQPNYRIHEIGVDGTGLRQITSDGDQAALRERYTQPSVPRKYQFSCGRYIDVDPCYLPNGNIMFASTRAKRSVACHPSIVTSLHVVDADGNNMRCLSGGQFTELDPRAMDDGRVIYMRWEYVDKGFFNVQSLWSMHPDGSYSDHVYKNNVVLPATLIDPRSIPGSQQIVAVGGPHGGRSVGPVILVDNRRSKRNAKAMTNVTPEIAYPRMVRLYGHNEGLFRQPYPLSEKLFLVSHDPNVKGHGHYGIYLLDAWGNRAEVYRDPEQSCFQPFPLRPRRKPPVIPPVSQPNRTEEANTATIFMQDVYRGMTDIERGRVKYVRVMQVMPTTWEEQVTGEGQYYLQEAAVSYKGDVGRKKICGIAKVHEDGSACFTVPANANLFFQALDEDYMELQRMRTFINLMPGEKRSCIGCHEPRRFAPPSKPAMAMHRPLQSLAPQPGDHGPRMVHYELDVQPTLDKHCVSCHGGQDSKGGLNLTGEPTTLWNRSYENLINKQLISHLNGGPGDANVRETPPLAFGSHRSKLVERIRTDPCRAGLTREEFIRIVTWIDANAPYYGTHEGKKNVKWKDEPDFRPVPLVGK